MKHYDYWVIKLEGELAIDYVDNFSFFFFWSFNLIRLKLRFSKHFVSCGGGES